MRVAVVGGGVSGLAAAHELAGKVSLTVYEKEESLGGHARAVDVDGALVDPGLMLFNSVTHPNMVRWFEELGVEMEPTDTSLSVSTELTGGGRCEWGWDSSRNAVSGLLARKSNALSPSFWHMIREVLRFQDDALAYLHKQESDPDLDRDVTLGQFVNSHGYSRLFQEAYLIPICACIWPCPTQTGHRSNGVLCFLCALLLPQPPPSPDLRPPAVAHRQGPHAFLCKQGKGRAAEQGLPD